MSVRVRIEWLSYHMVEPPGGMSDEEFEQMLEWREEDAWNHALAQVDSGTADLQNWEVA